MVIVCPLFPTFLARILPFYRSSIFPHTCSIMRTSSKPSHPSSLSIGGSSIEGSDLGQIGGGSGRPAIVVDRVPLTVPPSPYGKGKGKVSEIRYPGGFAYLRAVVHNAEAVGPSLVEPSFGHNFASLYRPLSGVRVWCLEFLPSYIVQVPNMVCFFEAAFKNGLRFPLHPFINVLQHFNVCLAQLSTNFYGVLVGLLVIFKDKGLGVPSIALLLDFFSVKESVEGFLHIAKHSNAKLIILDLPSSHKHWKERYFFVGGHN